MTVVRRGLENGLPSGRTRFDKKPSRNVYDSVKEREGKERKGESECM